VRKTGISTGEGSPQESAKCFLMIKNYLLVAWRNLSKKRGFSFINIAGLSVGMAAAILISLWVNHEINFDRFHKDEDRIFQVYNRYSQEGKIMAWPNTPKPMAQAISNDYPEVAYASRVSFVPPVLFSVGDKRITSRGNFVDSVFLDIFTFPLVKGDRKTVFKDVYSIVITEKLASQLFGTENPVGKIVKVDNSDNFTVTGVLKDRPNNTRFNFEFLIPWSYMRAKGWDDDYWSNNSVDTYVKLKANATLASIEPKIKTMRTKYDKNDPKIETFLYPFTRSHLYARFENGKEAGGKIEIVRLFAIVAGFILLIACINFMNLSTARSEKRAREVGIRKVVGAGKGSLIAQFLGESILVAFFAGIFAVLLVQMTLPAFNELVGKELAIDFGSSLFWLAGIAFVVFTGMLAGSYPAIFLSSFKPVNVLKGVLKSSNTLVTPRKVLVITQFTFAILLIIATIVVRQQIKNAQDRQVGYSREQLVYHFMEGEVDKNYMIIKQELLSSGAAVSVTKTSSPITEGWSNTWGLEWPGKDPQNKTTVNRFIADNHIVRTAGLQLVAGRDFDLEKYATDSSAALLNESAVKLMGMKDPIGQIIKDMGRDWHVVGVVKDFILNSPYRPLEPMFIAGAHGWFNVIHIKMNEKNSASKNIELMTKIFKKYNPEYDFNYRFADAEYEKKFGDEKRTGKLATVFAMLAIIISCLGLFGLASYMAENRIKEIGVRKVLGASVVNITRLLSVDFLKLVLVSFIIAAPIGYWAMDSWLQSFPYRVQLQWWVFALAGIGALFIALATVSYQAIKAAVANPVKSLRSE
jgi:putative ABC transport system permease protein